jgi:hypothetical protein
MRTTAAWSAVALSALLASCRAEPETPLTRAAAEGDVAGLRAALAGGATVNGRESGGLAPIHWAARRGQVDALAALIGAGADLNLEGGGNGWTPLQHAVHKNQEAAVRRLLDAGAQVDRRRPGEATALIMAAGYGQTGVAQALMDHGADPRAEAADGRNALWAAAGGGALFDLTDGPPLGTCFPSTIRLIRERAPDLRLPAGSKATLARWASQDCAPVVAGLPEATRPRAGR